MRISSAAPGIQYFDPDIPYRWGIQGDNKFMSPHGVFSVLIRNCSNGRTRWLDGFAICQFCPAVPTTIRGRIGGAPNLPSSGRSEEHTSELQSLMRISYAVFCLKKQQK